MCEMGFELVTKSSAFGQIVLTPCFGKFRRLIITIIL